MPPKKVVTKVKKAKKKVKKVKKVVKKASCAKDFRKGAILNTLAMKEEEPPPTECAGTYLFGCGIKYRKSCPQCDRRLGAMKTAVKNLKRDGARKVLENNPGLFAGIAWRVKPEDALKSLFCWKEQEQGTDFLKKRDFSFVMSLTLFRANGGRATKTADEFQAYVQALLDFVEEYHNSSIGKMGLVATFVNNSVNEATRKRLTDVGIVVHVIDSSICRKEICEDKVSGNMLLRYLALAPEFYGTCGKPIFMFDVDLTFSRPLQAAITNFVFVNHDIELQPQAFRATLDGYYDPKKGANATTIKWTIMGGLFGLRDEALIKVSENIKRVFDIVSDNKAKPAFVYGDDQTILADHIFPLIKGYRALTVRLTDGNIRMAEPVPECLQFASETFFGGRFFHNTELLS